ncbi:MAG: right-handed parallel beta-helix repeat-containing protein [Patescibacteria group bacterium]
MSRLIFKLFLGIGIFVFLGIGAYSFFTPVLADDYDAYVDEDFDEEERDGSSDKPFESIKEALKEAEKEGFEEIFIKEGVYKEDLDLTDSVKLIGEDKSEVVIKGKITMEDGSGLENLTIKNNIVVEGDADVKIKNCKVIDFSGIGIEALKGDGKVEVEDCEVSGDGKGFYIVRGREIKIKNCEVHHNKGEEGIDLRAELKGSIEDNKIYSNGESGIEVIVGGADLEIIDNDIEDNGSSAIATQFYPDWSDKGKILIKDNTLEDSDNYGIDCNRPQGGSGGSDYFCDSLELSGNKIQDNEKGDTADFCDLEKEENEEEKINTGQVQSGEDFLAEQSSDQEKEEEAEKREEDKSREKEKQKEEERKMIQEKKEEKERISAVLEGIEQQKEADVEIFAQKKNSIENKNSVSLFFFGPDQKVLKEAEKTKKAMENKFNQLQDLEKQANFKENKEKIIQKKEELKKEIESQEAFIEKQKNTFSLFGWLLDWFR